MMHRSSIHIQVPLIQLVLLLLLLNCKVLGSEVGLQNIDFPASTHYGVSIKPVPIDHWYDGQNVIYDDEDKSIWLNQNPEDAETRKASNIGKVRYKDAIQFKYDHYGMISFKTSFTFQIITTRPFPNCGSGMVFFIAPNYTVPERSYGRFFGLVSSGAPNSSRFFAVEFDTHLSQQFGDTSASHIGIDINSLASLKYVNSTSNSSYQELYLYENYTFTVWIEYDASQNLTQVWMTNLSSWIRPSSPCLTLSYSLSDVFEDMMYVGFSATSNASEDGMQGVAISAWNLTIYPPRSSKGRIHKFIITFAVLIFVIVVFSVYCYLRFKGRRVRSYRSSTAISNLAQFSRVESTVGRCHIEKIVQQCTVKRYKYEEVTFACRNFNSSCKIGEGTYSVVYKATLQNGETVAVKRLKEMYGKEDEFCDEVIALQNIRHRNLLPLLGWCYNEGETLLIYEYMQRGSLSRYLYGEDKGSLSGKLRLGILAGVASALEYLHMCLNHCVLHRDVKAANILLTEDFKPVLGDFGLARLVNHSDTSFTMTAAGSPGYIAPEVLYYNKVTEKSDVYSYGVLMVVVASGRPAVLRSSSIPSIVDWIWMLYQNNRVLDILDPTMCIDMPEMEKAQWLQVLHTALMCLNSCARLRPTMRVVCQLLQGDTNLQPHAEVETRPPFMENGRGQSLGHYYSRMMKSSSRISDEMLHCSGRMSPPSYATGEECEGR
ncbi:hypothetical protein KP509_13G034900 [Ceratopteris richardii]|uniref:Protein kinase domain-containing protein n=1 Tax=Ceratopteris richardii TaxID=49495 RepID=A0A8T2TEX2_CERRI|nr:hypothetical protein KP509_13G034900 [Ceratopteris richardii]